MKSKKPFGLLLFVFAELHERATRRIAGDFLRRLIATVPYRLHTMLTDNGIHFTNPKDDNWTAAEVKQLTAEKTRSAATVSLWLARSTTSTTA